MKKFIPLILFVFIANFCLGQTTEKQLKLVDFISIDTSSNNSFTIITVPSNKIWKIVNIITYNINSVSINNLTINYVPNYSCGNQSTQNNFSNYNGVPIWLKGGDQISFYYRCKISAFEFILE